MSKETSALLKVAFETFCTSGYANTTLDQIASRAGWSLDALTNHYPDQAALLGAALKAHTPHAELRAAILATTGDTAEDLLRNSTHRMIAVVQQHSAFFELAALDSQINAGNALTALGTGLLPTALQFIERVTATQQLRPVPTPVLARMLISLLIGYVASERMMPGAVQVMMRLFPQKAWLDSMVDLLLYGVLEDDQR
jgi:AcrR family transcriptional regulator